MISQIKRLFFLQLRAADRFGKTVEDLKASVDASVQIVEGGILNGAPDVEYLKEWVKKVL